ncbi:hypothetical protein CPB84DRAFT_1679335, partial [Gymnopilus junonius]
IFISFFFKKPKIRKAITVGPANEEQEIIVEEGDVVESEEDSAIMEEAVVDAEGNEGDDGQIAHDDAVVKSLHEVAIWEMRAQGVVMTAAEEREALKLFPAVAGLAQRIHDSSPLNEQFQELLINSQGQIQSNKTALDQRVPTQWNSDFDCLAAHLQFKDVVQSMTARSSNKLQAYRLSESQWNLAGDVQDVLLLFKDITLLFSQAEVPLIVDVIPTLFTLRDSLQAAANDDNTQDTPAVIRIASYAGVLLINKYMDLIWDCEIYVLAIVMCPDRKMNYLKNFKLSAAQLREIKKKVIDRFQTSYADEALVPAQPTEKVFNIFLPKFAD